MPKITIPLDASGVSNFKPDMPVKVALQTAKGLISQVVKFDAKGAATATFETEDQPSRVLVGPADATDEEIVGLDTLSAAVTATAHIPTLKITPFYWDWWHRWCREFVVHGRVVCPDGSPVPGARVCAFDVDGWFWHWSKQQIGCAFTDVNGVFELRFRWCCGWLPWWWWRHRIWSLNPDLLEKIRGVFRRFPHLETPTVAGHLPSFDPFMDLLRDTGIPASGEVRVEDSARMETIRTALLKKLPENDEMAKLHVWPWYPWFPWRDCNPDIIFQVTQNCLTPNTVIVNEGFFNTRWDAPQQISVTLTANDKACCRPHCHQPPCVEGECVVITDVCGDTINQVGGNTGAPAAPRGFLYPNAVAPGSPAYNADRPYAGTVNVTKNFGAMTNVDFYEIETKVGASWVPTPPGACEGFYRRHMHMVSPLFPTTDVYFGFNTVSGHEVVESKEHWEAGSGLGVWGTNYIWLSNEYLVVPIDSSKMSNGEHEFRVVGWQLQAGALVNRRVMPLCGTQLDNGLVLFFNNPGMPEPVSNITAVHINGQPVNPCGTANAAAGSLTIDFEASDADGFLATYTLIATYGLNQSVNLLNRPGSSVVALLPLTQTGWAAAPPTAKSAGTYGVALGQGATAPIWRGGRYRLTVPAAEAFPEPCCYQLELRVYARNIVSCDHNYSYSSLTEYTLGVGICP